MDKIRIARELLYLARELVSAIEFDTTQWEASHGGNPRGRGSWAFALDRAGKQGLKFSPYMTYGDAKKWAREQPEWKGVRVLYVQP